MMSALNEVKVKNETILDVRDFTSGCMAYIPFPKGMKYTIEAITGESVLISTFGGLLPVIITPELFKEIFEEKNDGEDLQNV